MWLTVRQEVFSDDKYYPSSDVYSFSVVMWEIMTRGKRYPWFRLLVCSRFILSSVISFTLTYAFRWAVYRSCCYSACTVTHTYIHTYTHTYIHTYTHTYIHSYIHTYTHTHTHAATHAHRHTLLGSHLCVQVCSDERLERPELCTLDLFSIMKRCWQKKRLQRPTFKQLVYEFEKLLQGAHPASLCWHALTLPPCSAIKRWQEHENKMERRAWKNSATSRATGTPSILVWCLEFYSSCFYFILF